MFFDLHTRHILKCSFEKGIAIKSIPGELQDDSNDHGDDGDYTNEEDEVDDNKNDGEDDYELNKMRSELVHESLKAGTYIGIYSEHNAFEMFYICKVIKCETAMDDTYDYYQHCIPKGTDYIVCKYLEKTDEKK